MSHPTIDDLPPRYRAEINRQLAAGKPIGMARSAEVGRVAVTLAPAKRIRQSSKPLLNKLETQWRDYLVTQYPGVKIHEQAVRFRLANGLHYTPDLGACVEGKWIFWECKGPKAFRGGFENLKSAAHQYQEIDWWLCWKLEGEWTLQKVLA